MGGVVVNYLQVSAYSVLHGLDHVAPVLDNLHKLSCIAGIIHSGLIFTVFTVDKDPRKLNQRIITVVQL